MATSGERSGPIAAADVLNGFGTTAGNQAATTFLTVPAGRTWVGTVTINVTCANAGANAALASAQAIVSTAGAGVTPPAGNILECDCMAGANVAGGTVGDSGANTVASRVVVIAPAGNAVQLQWATTFTGTSFRANVSAIGELQ